jgi:hypothetical protein
VRCQVILHRLRVDPENGRILIAAAQQSRRHRGPDAQVILRERLAQSQTRAHGRHIACHRGEAAIRIGLRILQVAQVKAILDQIAEAKAHRENWRQVDRRRGWRDIGICRIGRCRAEQRIFWQLALRESLASPGRTRRQGIYAGRICGRKDIARVGVDVAV